MRTFIALKVPDEFRFELAGLARQLREKVKGRFVSPEQYHLTLAFLGDIDERGVQRAIDALEEACAGAGPITLTCDGLGTFGKSRDATLWLGLRPTDELVGLANAVRGGLEARDVTFDSKSFKPHITIARRAFLPAGALPSLAFPEPASCSEVVLFKSELSAEGPAYHALHTVFLG